MAGGAGDGHVFNTAFAGTPVPHVTLSIGHIDLLRRVAQEVCEDRIDLWAALCHWLVDDGWFVGRATTEGESSDFVGSIWMLMRIRTVNKQMRFCQRAMRDGWTPPGRTAANTDTGWYPPEKSRPPLPVLDDGLTVEDLQMIPYTGDPAIDAINRKKLLLLKSLNPPTSHRTH